MVARIVFLLLLNNSRQDQAAVALQNLHSFFAISVLPLSSRTDSSSSGTGCRIWVCLSLISELLLLQGEGILDPERSVMLLAEWDDDDVIFIITRVPCPANN